MIEQLLLNGKSIKIYSQKEWFDMFTEHCDKIYDKEGDLKGTYCCGYHWCCDKCEQNIGCGCADCVATIIEIYESFGYKIDYSDVDFDNFEKKARELYESNTNEH